MLDRARLEESGSEDAHLSLETLAKWLAGMLEHDEVLVRVVPHFLTHCTDCRQRYAEIRSLQQEVGHWDEEVAVREGRQAPELWARLAALPYAEQLQAIEEDDELHTWGLCQLLLRLSRQETFSDPGKGVDLAHLALRVVRHLGAAYDPSWILDLRARCFAYLGNARRVLGELRSAEDAFVKAESCVARSTTGNPAVRAEILDLKSSLRRAQRRLDKALELAEEALALYRELAQPEGIGKMILGRAQILCERGELDPAIDLLRRSLPEIDAFGEPSLFRYARYNLLGCLALADRFAEAEALLPEIRALFRDSAQPLEAIRLRWTEGRVDLGLGRVAPAEAAFREVQGEFLRRGMGYDAALVSLDLARLLAQDGRAEELKRLAGELMPVFESRDVHREALVVVLMFQRACEEECLTVDLARQLAEFLRRERRGDAG